MIATVTYADGSQVTVEPQLVGMRGDLAVYQAAIAFRDDRQPITVEVDVLPGRSTLELVAQ